MNNPFIRTEALTKTYRTGLSENTIINHLNLSVNTGEFAVIMGNSGSGKSTLLYLLSGLDTPGSGKIWIDDIPVHGKSEKALAIMRRKMIGFVFQDNNLVHTLTIRENILVAGYLLPGNRKLVNEYAATLMMELGIGHLANRFPTQVSGGELQRAAIARAMINRPLVLMADEPTGNLNSDASGKVLECFSALNRSGQTIVMVTHDLKSACHGNRVLFLKDGKLSDEDSYTVSHAHPDMETQLFNWLKQRGW